jgi:hypothetical protein
MPRTVKRIRVFVDVDVFDETRAIQTLQKKGVLGPNAKTEVHTTLLGFVHSDGKEHSCAPPAKGFQILDNPAHLYRTGIWYCVPQKSRYTNRDLGNHVPLPLGSKMWDEQKERWVRKF